MYITIFMMNNYSSPCAVWEPAQHYCSNGSKCILSSFFKFLSWVALVVVVSVLATGPKGHGFKPGWGDGFLWVIQICSTSSFFRWQVKLEVPYHRILWHVEDPLRYLRHWIGKILTPSSISCYLPHMSLLVSLPESSDGRVRSYPHLASLYHHGSPCSHITWGMNNRPIGVRSSET
jgi:hypothetical protein